MLFYSLIHVLLGLNAASDDKCNIIIAYKGISNDYAGKTRSVIRLKATPLLLVLTRKGEQMFMGIGINQPKTTIS